MTLRHLHFPSPSSRPFGRGTCPTPEPCGPRPAVLDRTDTGRPEVVRCFEVAVQRAGSCLCRWWRRAWRRRSGRKTTTATLQGTVTGTDGTVVPGAEVVAWSRESGSARAALADVRGVYRLLGLPPGAYDVTARAVGFRALRRTGVELILGDEATLEFVLEPGAVELDPIVVRAGPSLRTERLDVSNPVLEREIERLPLNMRDVLTLASIAPGVRTYAPEAGRSIPAAGAVSSARFVNLYVDGVEWKGIATGQLVGVPSTGSLIPQEAIREYRVSR